MLTMKIMKISLGLSLLLKEHNAIQLRRQLQSYENTTNHTDSSSNSDVIIIDNNKSSNNTNQEPSIPSTKKIPCVSNRYVKWKELKGRITRPAKKLDYDENLWDVPGIHLEYELMSWWELEEAKKHRRAKKIGFDEETWDCWVNHYEGYEWEELEELGLAKYWKRLGWNKRSWYYEAEPPEDKFWDELSEKEKKAADRICYWRDSWDERPLSEYEWRCDED